jgi:hypothetical protein|tara:strand:+ start:219 stop:398 length:180 start_codon:yes stop_codon:yes gene_type:complete
MWYCIRRWMLKSFFYFFYEQICQYRNTFDMFLIADIEKQVLPMVLPSHGIRVQKVFLEE